MLGHFGFSYIGLIYMLMIEIPNIMWARRKPKGYNPSGENKVLLIFERVGQVLCTASILLFTDYNPRGLNSWTGYTALVVNTQFDEICILQGHQSGYVRFEAGVWRTYTGRCRVPAGGIS